MGNTCCQNVKRERLSEPLNTIQVDYLQDNEHNPHCEVDVVKEKSPMIMHEKNDYTKGASTKGSTSVFRTSKKSLTSNKSNCGNQEMIRRQNEKFLSVAKAQSSYRKELLEKKKAYKLLPHSSGKNVYQVNLLNADTNVSPVISVKTSSNNLLQSPKCIICPSATSSLNEVQCSPSSPNKHTPKQIINVPFTAKQLQIIKKLLFEEEILNEELDDATMIINSMYYLRLLPNETIFSKDSTDNIYYIIEKGKLEYLIDGTPSTLIRYDCIGTKALEKNSTIDYYLKSKEKSYLFCLPIDQYKTILTDFIDKDKEEKANTLKNISLFKYLDKRTIFLIANATVKKRFQNNKIILEENIAPTKIWYLLEGQVQCKKEEAFVKMLRPGDLIGDLQLFCQGDSLYTFISDNDTMAYEIQHKDLVNIIGENHIKKIITAIFSNSIKNCEMLSKHFAGDNLDLIFQAFQLKYYFNDTVYTNKQKKLIIPISGHLIRQNHDDCLSPITRGRINKGDLIGNLGVVFGDNVIDSVEKLEYSIATDEAVVFEGQWNDILKTLKCISNKDMSIFDRVIAIKSHHLFKNLSEMKLFQLAECLKTVKFKDNEVIIKDGPASSQFYIIVRGKVKIMIDHIEVRTLEAGQSFGDISSQSESYAKKASFIAKGNVECYRLEKDAFEEIIDCSVLKPLKKILIVKDITVTLDNLFYVKDLGCGSYGKVYLIHDQKRFYAMKTAEISIMLKNKQLTQYYLNEKTIMLTMDHPFIVQLINTFKTREYIFFLLEYVEGLTLKSYIETRSKESLRNVLEVTFYGGILLSVLNYLQKKKIIHRDLKPDNCMIGKNGYLKVIDFGVAKDLAGKDQTYTFIGSPQYIAPEVILGNGYGFSVDYWSVGIILYEIFYGKVPFGADCSDSLQVYREITEKKLVLPFDPKFKEFNNLLKQLLYKNPTKRINSFSKIRSHLLFQNFDFEKLFELKLIPPFFPKTTISQESDLSICLVPFTQFIKNNIYSSCADLDQLLRNNSNDMLSEF